MAIVRTKIFQRTILQPAPDEITTLINNVETLANQFSATMAADHVLDIQSVFTPAGKYGAFAHYQLRVTYLVD